MEFDEITLPNSFSMDAKNPEKPWNSGTNEDISKMGSAKVESLKEAIKDIDELISERKVLSKKVFLEGEKLKTQINNFLLQNEGMSTDDPMESRDMMKEKNDLRSKLISVAEMQLNEKVGSWKDIALLKRELREMKKELSERENRLEMLGKILEDEQ